MEQAGLPVFFRLVVLVLLMRVRRGAFNLILCVPLAATWSRVRHTFTLEQPPSRS